MHRPLIYVIVGNSEEMHLLLSVLFCLTCISQSDADYVFRLSSKAPAGTDPFNCQGTYLQTTTILNKQFVFQNQEKDRWLGFTGSMWAISSISGAASSSLADAIKNNGAGWSALTSNTFVYSPDLSAYPTLGWAFHDVTYAQHWRQENGDYNGIDITGNEDHSIASSSVISIKYNDVSITLQSCKDYCDSDYNCVGIVFAVIMGSNYCWPKKDFGEFVPCNDGTRITYHKPYIEVPSIYYNGETLPYDGSSAQWWVRQACDNDVTGNCVGFVVGHDISIRPELKSDFKISAKVQNKAYSSFIKESYFGRKPIIAEFPKFQVSVNALQLLSLPTDIWGDPFKCTCEDVRNKFYCSQGYKDEAVVILSCGGADKAPNGLNLPGDIGCKPPSCLTTTVPKDYFCSTDKITFDSSNSITCQQGMPFTVQAVELDADVINVGFVKLGNRPNEQAQATLLSHYLLPSPSSMSTTLYMKNDNSVIDTIWRMGSSSLFDWCIWDFIPGSKEETAAKSVEAAVSRNWFRAKARSAAKKAVNMVATNAVQIAASALDVGDDSQNPGAADALYMMYFGLGDWILYKEVAIPSQYVDSALGSKAVDDAEKCSAQCVGSCVAYSVKVQDSGLGFTCQWTSSFPWGSQLAPASRSTVYFKRSAAPGLNFWGAFASSFRSVTCTDFVAQTPAFTVYRVDLSLQGIAV